jgi:hypothetical protein
MLTLILMVFALLPHHHAPEEMRIAKAIDSAIQDDALSAPATSSHNLDATLMALVAWHESRIAEHPMPVSWDSKAGRVCGVWQLSCTFAAHASIEEQAREWLRQLHAYGLGTLSPDARHAVLRELQARDLLSKILSQYEPSDISDVESSIQE